MFEGSIFRKLLDLRNFSTGWQDIKIGAPMQELHLLGATAKNRAAALQPWTQPGLHRSSAWSFLELTWCLKIEMKWVGFRAAEAAVSGPNTQVGWFCSYLIKDCSWGQICLHLSNLNEDIRTSVLGNWSIITRHISFDVILIFFFFFTRHSSSSCNKNGQRVSLKD